MSDGFNHYGEHGEPSRIKDTDGWKGEREGGSPSAVFLTSPCSRESHGDLRAQLSGSFEFGGKQKRTHAQTLAVFLSSNATDSGYSASLDEQVEGVAVDGDEESSEMEHKTRQLNQLKLDAFDHAMAVDVMENTAGSLCVISVDVKAAIDDINTIIERSEASRLVLERHLKTARTAGPPRKSASTRSLPVPDKAQIVQNLVLDAVVSPLMDRLRICTSMNQGAVVSLRGLGEGLMGRLGGASLVNAFFPLLTGDLPSSAYTVSRSSSSIDPEERERQQQRQQKYDDEWVLPDRLLVVLHLSVPRASSSPSSRSPRAWKHQLEAIFAPILETDEQGARSGTQGNEQEGRARDTDTERSQIITPAALSGRVSFAVDLDGPSPMDETWDLSSSPCQAWLNDENEKLLRYKRNSRPRTDPRAYAQGVSMFKGDDESPFSPRPPLSSTPPSSVLPPSSAIDFALVYDLSLILLWLLIVRWLYKYILDRYSSSSSQRSRMARAEEAMITQERIMKRVVQNEGGLSPQKHSVAAVVRANPLRKRASERKEGVVVREEENRGQQGKGKTKRKRVTAKNLSGCSDNESDSEKDNDSKVEEEEGNGVNHGANGEEDEAGDRRYEVERDEQDKDRIEGLRRRKRGKGTNGGDQPLHRGLERERREGQQSKGKLRRSTRLKQRKKP